MSDDAGRPPRPPASRRSQCVLRAGRGDCRAARPGGRGRGRRRSRLGPVDAFLMHRVAAILPEPPEVVDLLADPTAGASTALWAAHPSVRAVRVPRGPGGPACAHRFGDFHRARATRRGSTSTRRPGPARPAGNRSSATSCHRRGAGRSPARDGPAVRRGRGRAAECRGRHRGGPRASARPPGATGRWRRCCVSRRGHPGSAFVSFREISPLPRRERPGGDPPGRRGPLRRRCWSGSTGCSRAISSS